MIARRLVLGSASLFSLLAAPRAQAQRVSADVRFGGGAVAGRIVVGNPGYQRRDDYRFRPRVVRVEMIRRGGRGHDAGWLRRFNRNARVVVVYYDRRDDRFYDRFRPGLAEYRAYECDGRFYRFEDERDFRGGRNDGRDGRRYDSRDNRDRRDGWDNDRDGR